MAKVDFAVVMAGGRGTRFWPRSRIAHPKQLIDIVGDRPMLAQTIERVRPQVGLESIVVVTDRVCADSMQSIVPELPGENVIIEPAPRNTAACIGLAALFLERRQPDGVMAVLPADHAILDNEAFLDTLERAGEAARSGNALVTIGIRPKKPETGYGYIKTLAPVDGGDDAGIFGVETFVEKPSIEKAEEYLRDGRYFWNSGMFIWKVSAILEAFEKYMPELHRGLESIASKGGEPDWKQTVDRVYDSLESVSIDYGVMERADNVVMVEASFEWDDVGSWAAIDPYMEADDRANRSRGRHITLGSKDCTVYTGERLVATIGLEGLVIVDTTDALLICPKDRAQDVKAIVEILEAEGLDEYL